MGCAKPESDSQAHRGITYSIHLLKRTPTVCIFLTIWKTIVGEGAVFPCKKKVKGGRSRSMFLDTPTQFLNPLNTLEFICRRVEEAHEGEGGREDVRVPQVPRPLQWTGDVKQPSNVRQTLRCVLKEIIQFWPRSTVWMIVAVSEREKNLSKKHHTD